MIWVLNRITISNQIYIYEKRICLPIVKWNGIFSSYTVLAMVPNHNKVVLHNILLTYKLWPCQVLDNTPDPFLQLRPQKELKPNFMGCHHQHCTCSATTGYCKSARSTFGYPDSNGASGKAWPAGWCCIPPNGISLAWRKVSDAPDGKELEVGMGCYMV